MFNSILLYAQEIQSTVIDAEKNKYFNKGTEEIKVSILKNINNLNLYEYSLALPELLSLLEANAIKKNEWIEYIDSLKQKVSKSLLDTVQPYLAIQHYRIIPLQAEYLQKTIELSPNLSKQYSTQINFILNTLEFENGYEKEELDSVVIISDEPGRSNYMFFLQLFSCGLISLDFDIFSEDFKKVIGLSLQIVSNEKIPYYLQKRKWKDLMLRFDSSNNEICKTIASNLKDAMFIIEDKEPFDDAASQAFELREF